MIICKHIQKVQQDKAAARLFFLSLLGFALVLLQVPVQADNVISGTIMLPAGDVAQAGGQAVTVYATEINSESSIRQSVVIPAGQSSKTYSLTLSSDPSTRWRILYDCGLIRCDDYVRVGYYAAAGTTWDESAATILSGGTDHSNVDMVLLEGDSISGHIALPSGDVAPAGGMYVGLLVFDSNFASFYGNVRIEAGENTAPYKRTVPSLGAANWYVKYLCSGSGCDPYYGFGWYSASGTKWSIVDANRLAGGMDHAGIDLTLLPGDHFRGRIILPTGETAPVGGTRFDVSLSDSHSTAELQKFLTIPEGDEAVAYDVVVPYLAGAEWTVAYICNDADCSTFVPKAYYLDRGMTLDESLATLFASGSDYSQIDLRVALDIPDSCAGSAPVFKGPLLYDGDYYCAAESSITSGQDGVEVGKEAYVVYSAPVIQLLKGFSVADQGVFRAGKDLLP